MIDRKHDLPISKQAEALNISRGSVYYLPRPVPKTELAIMHRLDRLHLEYAGSRTTRCMADSPQWVTGLNRSRGRVPVASSARLSIRWQAEAT